MNPYQLSFTFSTISYLLLLIEEILYSYYNNFLYLIKWTANHSPSQSQRISLADHFSWSGARNSRTFDNAIPRRVTRSLACGILPRPLNTSLSSGIISRNSALRKVEDLVGSSAWWLRKFAQEVPFNAAAIIKKWYRPTERSISSSITTKLTWFPTTRPKHALPSLNPTKQSLWRTSMSSNR